MPKGFAGVREAAAEINERKKGGGLSRIQWFRLKPGESAVVRFLEPTAEDDIAWAWMHQLQPRENQKFGDWEVCCNTANDGTACPGCERKLPRKFRGYINLIWKDGPIWERETVTVEGREVTRFKRDEQGNAIEKGRGPILAVWNQGIQVFEDLDGLDATYKGLGTRDFNIVRKGEGLNTKYQILPLDAEPMTEDEKKMAAEKEDLSPYVTPRSYDDWGKADDDSNGGVQQEQAGSVNPFMRPRS